MLREEENEASRPMPGFSERRQESVLGGWLVIGSRCGLLASFVNIAFLVKCGMPMSSRHRVFPLSPDLCISNVFLSNDRIIRYATSILLRRLE